MTGGLRSPSVTGGRTQPPTPHAANHYSDTLQGSKETTIQLHNPFAQLNAPLLHPFRGLSGPIRTRSQRPRKRRARIQHRLSKTMYIVYTVSQLHDADRRRLRSPAKTARFWATVLLACSVSNIAIARKFFPLIFRPAVISDIF